MGAPLEEIAKAEEMAEAAKAQRADRDVCHVYEENWESVMAFCGVSSQWLYAGMAGQRTGLNYPGVEAMLRLRIPKAKRRGEIFADIQLMEATVLRRDSAARQSEA